MNLPNQNALLRVACERHRALRIAGWTLVFGGFIAFAWLECFLHPIGAQ